MFTIRNSRRGLSATTKSNRNEPDLTWNVAFEPRGIFVGRRGADRLGSAVHSVAIGSTALKVGGFGSHVSSEVILRGYASEVLDRHEEPGS
jgi:hypothetical protein